jgi:hypothetical protein
VRRFTLAVLISAFGVLPVTASDQFTGNLTEAQITAIKMVTIARFAGTKNICPRFHFVEAASFRAMAGAGIPPEMLDSQEYRNVVAEAALGAIEKQSKNTADFCAATWQLLGPASPLHWQMLEAD